VLDAFPAQGRDGDFSKIHKYCPASQFHYFYGVSVAVDAKSAEQSAKSPVAQFLRAMGGTPMLQMSRNVTFSGLVHSELFWRCAQGVANPVLATAEQVWRMANRWSVTFCMSETKPGNNA
jgi:hypothetical protein